MARILIVDDDARITELLTDFLAEEGHQVGSANDGPDAFEEFQRLKPDLIITDYHMPGGSGAELVARIRASGGGKPVAAIVISGSAADDAAPDLSKLPRLRYLEKPVDLASLKRAVEELLAT
jgi:CheY-like chemotaxis protein